MNSESRILAAPVGEITWIRICGKGSFQNSPDLKGYVKTRIGEGGLNFVIDLTDCPTMDSTFMGTLTGFAIELMDADGATVEVVNANLRNQQLLQNLGLDQVLTLDVGGTLHAELRLQVDTIFKDANCQAVPQSELPKVEQAEHVLEAHEALSAANQENAPRFLDVVEYFRKDLEKHGS